MTGSEIDTHDADAGVLNDMVDPYLFEKRKPLDRPQLNQPMPFVGWSVAGELFTRNSIAVPEPPVSIPLQVQFNNQMQTHTIQFNAPDNDISVIGTGILCEAEIIWAVEGNFVRRVVSVADGMAVSGEAQSVVINIYDMSLTNTVVPYRVGCTVAPGIRGNIQQPPTLRVNGFRTGAAPGVHAYSISLAPGEFTTYTIPPNVGAISSYITVDGGLVPVLNGEVRITHVTVSGATMRVYSLGGCFRYVPLYGITKSIVVTNTRAVGDMTVSHVLGIEG